MVNIKERIFIRYLVNSRYLIKVRVFFLIMELVVCERKYFLSKILNLGNNIRIRYVF